MQSSRKEKNSGQNLIIYNQLVKLTKQNQYLHVKVEALYQQLDSLFRTKEKYKNKYRVVKEVLRQKEQEAYEQIGREIEENDKNQNEEGSQKEDYILSKLKENSKNPQYFESLEEVIEKVNQNVNQIAKKLSTIIKVLQNHQNSYLMGKVWDMGETLNSIAMKIRLNEEENHFKSEKSKSRTNREIQKIPERDTSNIGKFVDSRSQKSFPIEKQENPQKKEEEKGENWKLLQEIGKQLKNWRFSLSDQQY